VASSSTRASADLRGITVAAALRSRPLADGVPEILAGAAGLNKPVRWVHSVEAPRIASLLRGGELLLMTGMGLPEDDASQRRFMAALAERDVAGVVIELGTALNKMPLALISEAEACNLPLIALHREVPFVEVTEVLHREIVNHQALALERGEEAHRRFTDLVLEGAGVPEVLEALADLIGNPVVLEKADEGAVYHEPHHVSEAALHAAWDATARGLPEAPARASSPVHTGRRRRWGTLHALAMSGPLNSLDRVALERGADVIALVLLRRHQEQELAARERGQFIATLMDVDAVVDEREAATLAADLGFDRLHVLRLPVVVVRSAGGIPGAGRNGAAPWGTVWREVVSELSARQIAAVTGLLPGDQGLGLIVALHSADARQEAADRVSRVVREAVQRKLGQIALTVCVGPVARSWAAVGGALHDALEVAHATAQAPDRAWHDATTPDINRLFWALRDQPALRTFVHQSLDAVIDHDRHHRSQLLTTIEAYCEHGGRVAEAARALHLGRQSLYKRIARIEKVIAGDLADPDTRLGLHLALMARRYLGEGGGESGAAQG
jgi:PucR family transcriptional regulator, purine catabolism regulatory protein